MRKVSVRGCGGAAGAWVVLLALMVTACAPRPDGPAPVISGSGQLVAPAEPERISVRPGQTLSGIAHEHHVPMRILAEANHLLTPYRIEAGNSLIIPRTQPAASPPSPSLAALPPRSTVCPPLRRRSRPSLPQRRQRERPRRRSRHGRT